MKDYDYKKRFIEAIPKAYSSSVTLITAAGMFSGSIADVKEFEFEGEEAFFAKLKEIAKTEDIKLKSLALTWVDVMKNQHTEVDWKNSDDLVHLEDVTFISNSGQEKKLQEITVSASQVIAIFGGEVSIS